MTNIVVAGAGGFGREVLVWLQHAQPQHPDWRFAGFLDDRPDALAAFGNPYPVLGSPHDYQPAPGELLLCAIGDPATRRKLTTSLEQRGANFATLVHPSAVVGPDVEIGPGSIVCPQVTLTTNIRIGRSVVLNIGSVVGHDASIGDFTTLSPHCSVTGFARLGEGVFMGTNAAVMPSVQAGDCARIAAGSVAFRNVRPGATVIGVPATLLR